MEELRPTEAFISMRARAVIMVVRGVRHTESDIFGSYELIHTWVHDI